MFSFLSSPDSFGWRWLVSSENARRFRADWGPGWREGEMDWAKQRVWLSDWKVCVLNFISFHFILFYFILFYSISFHFISFHFIPFHFISFHFISFHFISFHKHFNRDFSIIRDKISFAMFTRIAGKDSQDCGKKLLIASLLFHDVNRKNDLLIWSIWPMIWSSAERMTFWSDQSDRSDQWSDVKQKEWPFDLIDLTNDLIFSRKNDLSRWPWLCLGS